MKLSHCIRAAVCCKQKFNWQLPWESRQGGSYVDQILNWGVSRPMTFPVFLDIIQEIKQVIPMTSIPLSDEPALRVIANEFQQSRQRENPFYRWVDGLNGIVITIRKPPYDCVFFPRLVTLQITTVGRLHIDGADLPEKFDPGGLIMMDPRVWHSVTRCTHKQGRKVLISTINTTWNFLRVINKLISSICSIHSERTAI